MPLAYKKLSIDQLKVSESQVELVQAARDLASDHPARTSHKTRAGCNFGETIDACMQTGLGQDGYDCSGFVLAARSLVQGTEVTTVSRHKRHTRQLNELYAEGSNFDYLQLGDVAVLGRIYTFDGKDRLVAGHMGIVTERYAGGLVLAHTVDELGYLAETPISSNQPDTYGMVIGRIPADRILEK